jgi:hypothetical protein
MNKTLQNYIQQTLGLAIAAMFLTLAGVARAEDNTLITITGYDN